MTDEINITERANKLTATATIAWWLLLCGVLAYCWSTAIVSFLNISALPPLDSLIISLGTLASVAAGCTMYTFIAAMNIIRDAVKDLTD